MISWFLVLNLKIPLKFVPPVHNNNNENRASTLLTSIYAYFELPVESHPEPDFTLLRLHTFNPIKRKRSRAISLSKVF